MNINDNQNLKFIKQKDIKCLQANLQKARPAIDNLIETITREQIDISLIQEPYTKNNEILGFPNRWKLIYQKEANPPRAAILISNPNWNPTTIKNTKDLISIELNTIDKDFIFCSVYADGNLNIEDTLNDLDDVLDHTNCKNIIIGGDFNSHNIVWGYPKSNERGNKVLDYINSKNLFLQNTNKDPPTFQHNNSKGWPDLTFNSIDMTQHIQNWEVTEDITCSDHNYIKFTIGEKTQTIQNKRYNSNSNKQKFIKQIKLDLSNQIKEIKECNNVIQLDNTVNNLIEKIKVACEKTFKIKNRSKLKAPNWWNKELKSQRSKIKALRRRFKKTTDTNERKQYILIYKKELAIYKKNLRETKNKSWAEYCTNNKEKFGTLHKIATNKIFKPTNFTSLKNQTNNADTTNTKEILSKIIDEVFPEDNPNLDTIEQKDLRNELNSSNQFKEKPFSNKEIQFIINKLNKKKAPGPDSIDNQIIQYVNKAIPNLFKVLFNKCLELEYFPKHFKTSTLILFNKPNKNPNEPGNFRPICLLPTIGKVLEKLIINRLKHHLTINKTINEKQYGFRTNTSTENAICDVLNTLKHNRREKKHSLFITLDLKGAFDTVWWPSIRDALRKANCPINIYNILNSYLNDRKTNFTYDGGTITKILERGCPQGSCGGPDLWNLTFNDVFQEDWPTHTNIIAFADDVGLIISGNSNDELNKNSKESLDLFQKYADKKKLIISYKKCAAIRVCKTNTSKINKSIILINNNRIKQTESVKYLGLMIDQTLNWVPHIQYLKVKTNNILRNYRSMVGTNWGLRSELQKIFYQVVIEPTICYAAAAWGYPIIGRNKKSIKSLQRPFLLAITRSFRTTSNEALNVLAGITPINLKLEETAIKTKVTRLGISITDNNQFYDANTIENKINQYDIHPANKGKNIKIIINKESENNNQIDKIYTDGSKIDNLVGAAFTHFNNNQEINNWKGKLNEQNSIFQAEAIAIKKAIKYANNNKLKELDILSDSQSVLKSIDNPNHPSPIINKIQKLIHNSKIDLNLKWIKGHSNNKGNDRADELAKEATTNGTQLNLKTPKSYIVKILKENTKLKWQDEWDNTDNGRATFDFISRVSNQFLVHNPHISRYITGHGPCPAYFHRFGSARSNMCICGGVGDMDHYIMECELTREHHLKFNRNNLANQKKLIWNQNEMLKRIKIIMAQLQDNAREYEAP